MSTTETTTDETNDAIAAVKRRAALDELKPSEDCCPQWESVIPIVRWFSFADKKGLMVMAHIPSLTDDSKWRINYCPCCGKDARDRLISRDRLIELMERYGA